MSILMFLLSNWDSVLVVISSLVGVIAFYKKGESKILREILFRLVVEAERLYGSGTGELKKAAVIEWIYEKLPVLMKVILSKKGLECMIEDALDYAKEKWKVNQSLNGYVYGGGVVSVGLESDVDGE